jgi:hypothetical protein
MRVLAHVLAPDVRVNVGGRTTRIITIEQGRAADQFVRILSGFYLAGSPALKP